MDITLQMFGILRERFGRDEVVVQTEAETVRDMLGELFSTPELSDLETWPRWLRVARDDAYIDLESGLRDGDKLALIPPVSGGRLPEPISVGLTAARLESLTSPTAEDYGPDCGSLVRFDGLVRADTVAGEQVTEIHYEAHEPMALKVMRSLAEEICREHGLLGVWIRHRIGIVLVGESAIRVEIASRHRQEGFLALTSLMDVFKKDVPIFKKELVPGGNGRWVGLEDEP